MQATSNVRVAASQTKPSGSLTAINPVVEEAVVRPLRLNTVPPLRSKSQAPALRGKVTKEQLAGFIFNAGQLVVIRPHLTQNLPQLHQQRVGSCGAGKIVGAGRSEGPVGGDDAAMMGCDGRSR